VTDAVVVGSGPNGLAAAITLARAGRSVTVYEAQSTIGGGTRSEALTLPGFLHDVCSAIHPLALASPFFKTVPLEEHGLQLIQPPAPLGHPLGDGAVMLERSVAATARSLGLDERSYRGLFDPLVRASDALASDTLGPLRVPRHPLAMARFGVNAVRSAKGLARRFETPQARALIAGIAAHSMLALDRPITAAYALVLAMLGHAVGWPIPRGGSQKIADALTDHLAILGGKVVTDHRIASLDEVSSAPIVILDVTPRQLLDIAGDRLPPSYKRQLTRFRYGPGVFKVDWALDGPIPWRDERCLRAGTVHLGGTFEEIAGSESAVAAGHPPEKPYVLLAQQSLFDAERAPEGKHAVWTYCHVPNASTFDMTDRIAAQIERFAPGFRDRILARSVMMPQDLQRHDENYVGGDINGGLQSFGQLWTRPVRKLVPYLTPVDGVFICSSSTPPGGGVHGMCGYFAARVALRSATRRTKPRVNRRVGRAS
jgi:phytoene dehydrogenase-like protein